MAAAVASSIIIPLVLVLVLVVGPLLEMLARAMNDAKSIDPLKVARALEGMKYQSDTGEVWMRADDHQLMQPIYIATFTKAGGKDVKIDAEGTGYGWKTDLRIEPADTVMPTSCVMTRP